MKATACWAMIFALLNVITICPLAAQSMPASSSCCSHSKGHEIPCTDSTAKNCPYVLLEKAKSERTLAAVPLSAVIVNTVEFHPQHFEPSPIVSQYYPDSSESYLLHRVLRR